MDHDAQVEVLRAAAERSGARFNVVDCLGPCERSNVVVIRTDQQRRWLGGLGDPEVDQLAGWVATGDQPMPASMESHVFAGPNERSRRRLLPERGADLADLLAGWARTTGLWALGIPGAGAELDTSVEPLAVTAGSRGNAAIVTAIGVAGAMRVVVDQRTRAFAFGRPDAPQELEFHLVVRTGEGLVAAHGLQEVGPDVDPIDETGLGMPLFDLGLGRDAVRVMVRVADADLVDRLRRLSGAAPEALDAAMIAALDEASATAVVETALGRMEMSAAALASEALPSSGTRLRLLLDVVREGADLPAGVEVPKGWLIGPSHHPSSAIDLTGRTEAEPVVISPRR